MKDVSIEKVAYCLRHPERFPQPRDVLSLKVSNWSEAGHDLFLRLTRLMLITATYDTWYRVRHQVQGPTRIDSVAVATRIEEVSDPGSPTEKRVPVDASRGFLWRMQTHWRFSVVPRGCRGDLRVDHPESPGAARARHGVAADCHAGRAGVDDYCGSSVAERWK